MLTKEDAIHFLISNAASRDASGGLYDDVCDGDAVAHIEGEVRFPYVLYRLTAAYPDGTDFHSGLRYFDGPEDMREFLDRNICRGAGEAVMLE